MAANGHGVAGIDVGNENSFGGGGLIVDCVKRETQEHKGLAKLHWVYTRQFLTTVPSVFHLGISLTEKKIDDADESKVKASSFPSLAASGYGGEFEGESKDRHLS